MGTGHSKPQYQGTHWDEALPRPVSLSKDLVGQSRLCPRARLGLAQGSGQSRGYRLRSLSKACPFVLPLEAGADLWCQNILWPQEERAFQSFSANGQVVKLPSPQYCLRRE